MNHIQKWTLPEEQIIFWKKIYPVWPYEDAMNGIKGFKQSFVCFVVVLLFYFLYCFQGCHEYEMWAPSDPQQQIPSGKTTKPRMP